MTRANRLRSALCVAVVALAAGPAEAGPWTLGQGRVYTKVTLGYLPSTLLANPDGSTAEIPRFVKRELYLYGAVGVTPKLTAFANLPVVRSSDLAHFRRESGVGDLQVGAQYGLGRGGPWVFAVRGALQVPTGDETLADGILPSGSGVWEGELAFSAGGSLWGGKGYGFVEAGHQFRQTLRDGFVYAGQLGWNATPRLILAVNVRGVEPYDKQANLDVLDSAFVGLGDRVTYVSYGPSAIVKLGGGVSLQLDLLGLAHTRNIARGPTFSVGLAYSN
jgi:hypothetical protein